MEHSANRPQRLQPEQVDGAVDEALQRINEGADLPQEELEKINGGKLPFDPIDVMGAMVSSQ